MVFKITKSCWLLGFDLKRDQCNVKIGPETWRMVEDLVFEER